MTRSLREYRKMRDFARTSEPEGGEGGKPRAGDRAFLVQKHAASRLHWDLRLEWDGVLLSWAVTRGPSAAAAAKRLAVRTEDHPLDYARFEGVIPKPGYGAGTVMLWDRGTWAPLGDLEQGLREGKLKFVLSGERMRGAWALVRMSPRPGVRGENWLLIKEKDSHVSEDVEGLVETHLTSVATGRDMAEIAAGVPNKIRPKARKAKAKGAPPAFQPVQLAKLQTSVPAGEDWLHEVKVDGYRCQAALGGGVVRLYTRSGLDWTTTFGDLEPAFAALPCDSALIDGEVVAAGVERQAFSALQTRLKQGGALDYVAFDLLHLDGHNLTKLPLVERKALLEQLLQDCSGPIRYSTHIEGHGDAALAQVCAAGREGLISKLGTAPYHAGRHGSWIKLKCEQRQEFVIGGWVPSSSRGRPFASLVMGTFDGARLVYRGRVGTGFDSRAFAELQPLLEERARKTSPFAKLPSNAAKAEWVTPDLVAEIRFTELTEAGHIRHGTYQALRHDKPARAVTLDRAEDVPAEEGDEMDAGDKVLGVRITHPDRKVFDSPAVTKLQVAEHDAALAQRMLPFLRHRPVSLLRCPGGTMRQCFFQKHRGEGMPASIGAVAISEAEEDQDYITFSSAKSLVAAAQMGAIEFHIWGSSNATLDLPDRVVFDLDPDESLPFAQVRRAAHDLREVLEALGLPSVPMLTGGKGMHVIVPLRPKAGWDTVKLFSRTVAVMLSDAAPDRFIATMSKAKRKGLIFIDWLRNERGATAIAPYSLRARPGAKVAVPVTWEELDKLASAGAFDIFSVRTRLEHPCPLQMANRRRPVLGAKVLERLQRRVMA